MILHIHNIYIYIYIYIYIRVRLLPPLTLITSTLFLVVKFNDISKLVKSREFWIMVRFAGLHLKFLKYYKYIENSPQKYLHRYESYCLELFFQLQLVNFGNFQIRARFAGLHLNFLQYYNNIEKFHFLYLRRYETYQFDFFFNCSS